MGINILQIFLWVNSIVVIAGIVLDSIDVQGTEHMGCSITECYNCFNYTWLLNNDRN